MSMEKSASDGALVHSFEMGEEVLDRDSKKLGKVRARFSQYILVERGGLFSRAYYVPKSAVTGKVKGAIHLSLSEDDLRQQGLDSVPDDLYHEPPEMELPRVTGVPLVGLQPLSPAQTGHYSYGRRWPGMNTDASHSYHRDEVMPVPQRVVEEADELDSNH
jgi:hypothetical protein